MKPKIRILKLLSISLSPPPVAIIMSAVFSSTSSDVFLSEFLGVLFLAVIPTLPFLYLLRKGLTDIEIRSRRTRVSVLAAAALSYALSSAIFYYLGYHAMFAISLDYALVSAAILFNNFFWKISIHAAGVAGPTTALVYVFGANLIPLYVFTAAVFYARLKLKAHTPAQLIGGAAVAVAVTFLTYLVFY